MCTNHLPRIGSTDNGTWARIAVAPCRGNFRDQKNEVKNYADFLVERAGGAVLCYVSIALPFVQKKAMAEAHDKSEK